MKFWNLLSFVEDEQLIEAAQYSEQLGFEAVGVSDHLFIPERIESRYPGTKAENGRPFFTVESRWSFPDPWVALGMIAASTRRVKLMQSIFILPPRNPIDVAKAAGTLAAFAPGRLRLCPAVGWMKEECDIYGVDFHTRGRRADEMIEVIRKLWTGDIVEHQGEFFSFPRLRMLPAPGHVPIIPAGPSEAVMRRAARLGDGYMDQGNRVTDMPALIAKLNAMRREAGRDHLPFEVVMVLKDPWDVDLFRRAQDMGVTAIQLLPAFFVLGKHSTLDEKKALWDSFAEKALRHFPLDPLVESRSAGVGTRSPAAPQSSATR
jgi:probable F420-dependent oxidoreductase